MHDASSVSHEVQLKEWDELWYEMFGQLRLIDKPKR